VLVESSTTEETAMLEIHEFLTNFDDSGTYAAKDYAGFAAETVRHINEC
jgi:hypothetical protein